MASKAKRTEVDEPVERSDQVDEPVESSDPVDEPVDESAQTTRTLFSLAVDPFVGALVEHTTTMRSEPSKRAVFKARVATRRLRANLTTLESILDRKWAKAMERELRWAADALGSSRDLDVLRKRLRRQAEAMDATRWPATTEMLDTLSAQRAAALATTLETIASPRFEKLIQALQAASKTPPLAPSIDPDSPADKVLLRSCRKVWKSLERAMDRVDKDSTDEVLHRVRIKVKRARYAFALATGLFGEDASELAELLAGVQDVLGEVQDAATATLWLEEFLRTHTDAESKVLVRALLKEQKTAGKMARKQRKPTWKQASSKHATAWLHT